MAKVKIATDWLAGCAGCHMSLLDIDERIVGLSELVEFTSSPITDLKHPPKEGVTVGILEGAICNTHNIEVAKQMRERCDILIAVGDCATFGGVPAMRNLVGTDAALKRAYLETESTVDGIIPDSPTNWESLWIWLWESIKWLKLICLFRVVRPGQTHFIMH